MRPVNRLHVLHSCSRRRLGRFAQLMESHVEHGRAATDTEQADRITAYVAIEALNLWTEFVRSFYLSCATRAIRLSGSKVTAARRFNNTGEALSFAIRVSNPRRRPPYTWWDEPKWGKSSTILQLDRQLTFSNSAEIGTAMSYPSTVLDHLPAFRNFFSHRGANTAQKALTSARAIGVHGTARPAKALQAVPSGPVTILRTWLADLDAIVDLMCL
jgi:hypothetical protein